MTDHTTSQPTKPLIEIAGYRDPDDEVTTQTFVNGEPIVVDRETVVDPGAGYPYDLSEWRRNTFEVGQGDGSPAWKRAVITYYQWAEGKYTRNDMTPAVNMETSVTAVDQFTITEWIGEAEFPTDGMLTGASSGDDLARDNTLRAGWALFAVQAYHALTRRQRMLDGLRDPHRIAPATAAEHSAAATAVGAYAQLTSPNASIENLPNLVADLLSNLHHLADAFEIELAWPLTEEEAAADDAHATLAGLIADLGRAYPVWIAAHPELTDPRTFAQVHETAYERYVEEVTGEFDPEVLVQATT